MAILGKLFKSERGQSMTEFALVALFAVVIFGLFRGSDLLSMSKNTYNNVGNYLSGTPTSEQAIHKYGTMSNTNLRQSVSNDVRIAMDDATLRNIAGAFLGKTKDEINAMLASPISDTNFTYKYKPNGPLNQGILLFDYYIDSADEDGAVKTRIANGVTAKDNLLNWMQGNYTEFSSTQMQVESDNRYFFSDDLIDKNGILSATPQQPGEYAVSVRCAFEIDQTTKTVSAVQIYATRNKEDTYKPKDWVRDVTQGLGENGNMNIRVTK